MKPDLTNEEVGLPILEPGASEPVLPTTPEERWRQHQKALWRWCREILPKLVGSSGTRRKIKDSLILHQLVADCNHGTAIKIVRAGRSVYICEQCGEDVA
jgi:hypothetical protein